MTSRSMIRILFLLLLQYGMTARGADFSSVQIALGSQADQVERNVAALLQARLTEYGGIDAMVVSESDAIDPLSGGLTILLGIPDHHEACAAWLRDRRIPELTERNPGPEGFLIESAFDGPRPVLIAASVDDRGALYAVGEILRRIAIHADRIEVADGISVRTAPAFEVRGTQYGQSYVAKSKAHVRDWTDEETQRVILDYALAGANTFEAEPGPMFDFLKSYGLMVQGGFGANTGSGPPAWEAKESIGRTGYVCLSVPEAVDVQIARCEAQFKDAPAYDFIKFHGGDGGGCECDKCDPYGLTFIKVVEKMAAAIHKYHPTTRIWFTNQKFDVADDEAILAYLREKPRDWLWAWGYGPGSDGMSWQPGHRQTHNMELFRYPGFGPFDRYNQYLVHQLPPEQVLMHYNEITHWRYSQHGYVQMAPRADRNGDLPPWWNPFIYERRPDRALTMVYDRLTFYAWPRYYHWVFGEVDRYGVGDTTHSSGHHDHFNQWMWQRLLWAPQTGVEAVVDEYCRTWFGEAAAPYMAKALFQLEENLEEQSGIPITEKYGIDNYYDLVEVAGDAIPPHRKKTNWLWREYMQKAALDRYIKLAVGQQNGLQTDVELRIAQALEDGDFDAAIDECLPRFDQVVETPVMKGLRAQAEHLGEESNALFGVRSEGMFNLEHDYIGLGWLKRQLQRAREAAAPEETRALLRMIVAYEDPGPGGFYDNCGTMNPCPNVVAGYPYDHGQPYVAPMLDEGNRPSQRSMHFTQDETQGVTFEYRDLDPAARYSIRFTFVRPWYQERYAFRMNQTSQSIYADDRPLAVELALPPQMSDFYTFDIPEEATADGALVVRLEKAHDVAVGDRVTVEQWRNSGGWGTLVSEVWLMKK